MSNLQFQDFNLGVSSEGVNSTNTDYRAAGQIGDRAQLFDSHTDCAGEKGRKANFFSFEFYQHYFDVDTDQVASRILNSMVPRFRTNFITDYIQPIPDLYGPFWICVTLVFTTAICGNLAKYVETNGDIKNHEYGSDFRLVTGASTLIACYVILTPFALYSLFWYRRSELQYSYLEILCAYGYSLSIFVPVSMLWVIHAQWFRWFLILISVALSGTVLIGSIWPAVRNDHNKAVAFGTVAVVLLLHAFVAIGFKEFYFDASQPARSGHLLPPEHPAVLPNGANGPSLEMSKLPAVEGNIVEGSNSSKRAAVETTVDKESTVVANENVKAVDTKKDKTAIVGTEGGNEKSEEVKSVSTTASS